MAQNRESPRKKARVALPTVYAPKTAVRAGGGMLTNCYAEIGRDARVVKRPGMSNLGPVAVDCVSGQGTTFFNNDVAYVTCDVLKIGSCVSGLPASSEFLVGAASDSFAVYSPRTGFVWTADNVDSTVRVRNYTSGTLVATIPPPANGNHGSSGMCYLPDLRSFCVVQSGPLSVINGYDPPTGGPLFWIISEDTYAITQVVKCQASIANTQQWVGSPVYLQSLGVLLLLWNNGISSVTLQSTYGMSGWGEAVVSGTFPADPDWVLNNTLTLDMERKYATMHYQTQLSIVDYSGTATQTNYTISHAGQQQCPMAYDSSRRRIYVCQTSPATLSYIDVSTNPPGALTFVANLPKAMFNFTYDVNKDVLWAVSTYDGSNTIYKLNPANGAVLASQTAAFSDPGQYWQFTQALSCSVVGFSAGRHAWTDNVT